MPGWLFYAGVCDEHFYIISFQSLFEFPDEEGYQPCEVACVDYTLNFGIVREWHKFIDPGNNQPSLSWCQLVAFMLTLLNFWAFLWALAARDGWSTTVIVVVSVSFPQSPRNQLHTQIGSRRCWGVDLSRSAECDLKHRGAETNGTWKISPHHTLVISPPPYPCDLSPTIPLCQLLMHHASITISFECG